MTEPDSFRDDSDAEFVGRVEQHALPLESVRSMIAR